MSKYEDILKEIDSMTYTPVENRNQSFTVKNNVSTVNKTNNSNKALDILKKANEVRKVLTRPLTTITSALGKKAGNYATDVITDTKSQVEKAKQEKKNPNVKDTLKYLGGNALSGLASVPEGIADIGAAALKVAGKATSKLVDNKVGEFIFGKDAGDYKNNPLYQIGQSMVDTNISQDVAQMTNEKLGDTSYVDSSSKLTGLAQGVGQVGGLILTGNFTGIEGKIPTNTSSKVFNTVAQSLNNPTSSTMFLSVTGNSYSEALKNGATEGEAIVYGLLNGAKETATEVMYGGLGSAFGKGALDDYAKEAITSHIKSKIGSKAAELGISMTAEGLEEVVATLLDPFVKYVYKHELDFSDYKTLMDDFIVGALTSGVLEGGQITVDKMLNKGNSTKAQETFNNVINEGNIQTNTNTNINEEIVQNMPENVSENAFNEQELNTTLEELKSKREKTANKVEQNRLNKQINDIETKLNELDNKFQSNNIIYQSFNNQVDAVLNGNYPKNSMLIVNQQTPQILQEIGLRDLPITMTQRHLDTIINAKGKYTGANYHNLGVNVVKQLPKAIEHPLNVLQSDTDKNSIVVITELADNQDRPVIASIKIDGTGNINDIEIDSNVLTSAYGRNNYDEFMKRNISKGNLLYDIDEGIIKRSDGKLQLRPTTSFSNINSTTNKQNSQISGVLPTNSISKTSENMTPPTKNMNRTNKKVMNALKSEMVIKADAEKIANQLNNSKQRSWVETSTESDVLKDKIFIKDLDVNKINYIPQSNKKSLNIANDKFDRIGYDNALNEVRNMMDSDKLPRAEDVALAERLLQEASKKGDSKVAQELVMDISIMGTDLGQATQALSIIKKLTPEGQLKMYETLVKRAKARGETSFENVEITPEMVEKILKVYKGDGTFDQTELNQAVEDFKQDIANQLKTTVGEKVDAWRYLSMLGNPKTHIRNIVSNVAMKGTIKVKNAMARTIESILDINDRTKTWKKSTDYIKNFADTTANEMKSVITGEAKYNEKTSIESKKQIFKNKTLEKISNFNSDALEAEDWFFSKSAFKSTFAEYLTANGINTEADIQNNPEIVQKGISYAVQQAEIATFRQYSKLASQINQIERNNKVAGYAIKATVPFKKTPINVAKAGFNYSPLGFIKNVSYDVYQLKTGNINASQFIDNISQGMTGTALTLLGYALAKAGFIKGSGDDDKEGKYDTQLGDTGYSIKIGNKSYSLSWLSPVAMPLFVGVNAFEQLEEQKDWDANVVVDTLAKTLDPLNEMSFLQSLTNVLSSYSSGTAKIAGMGESVIQNYVGQFFPTLFSQIASTTDSKKRSTKASNNSSYKFGEQTIRSIMYKLPGLRQQLEVATDVWGNEKEQSDNIIERAYESFIAPYSKTKNISTNLDKEIKRLYNETGETKVIPSIPYAYTKYGQETYKMSAKEYTQFKKTYGSTANNILNKLISSIDYKNASNEEKVKMIDNVYEYARANANAEYFENIPNVDYESKMLDKINTLNKQLGISAEQYFGNKNEYDYAYNNPSKYATLTKIAPYNEYQQYKDKIKNIKENTTNDKYEVIKYINSLNLSIPQKAMFIKQCNYKFNDYNQQIVEYINNQKISKNEKIEILQDLGFTIRDGRVYW